MHFNPAEDHQIHSAIDGHLPSSSVFRTSKSLTSLAASIKSIYELQVKGTSDKLFHELLVTASCAYIQEIQLEIKLHACQVARFR